MPYRLRRIEVYDPETEQLPVFLTNNLTLGATTIAAIYKERWQMEIFFKALKQNLKIKTFVGTSANAVKIQIWTAVSIHTKKGIGCEEERISVSQEIGHFYFGLTCHEKKLDIFLTFKYECSKRSLIK
jgi:hypothetical protein